MLEYEYFLIVFATLSALAFLCYGSDKHRAKRKQRRTPEAVLLSLGFFGGAAGALLGMQVFRHKTRHWYFWLINSAGLAWQVALVIFIYFTFQ